MKEESLLLLSDLQKLINQVVLIDYTIIILGGEKMKKLVKRSDVMQETLEAYCSCSCSCYGTCSCSTGQTNNSAALFQARYTQFYMDFVAIRMV